MSAPVATNMALVIVPPNWIGCESSLAFGEETDGAQLRFVEAEADAAVAHDVRFVGVVR